MTTDEIASAMAAKRWAKTTKKQRSAVGKSLSESRWDNATPEERAAHGQMLAQARAKKKAEREAGETAVKKTAVKKKT